MNSTIEKLLLEVNTRNLLLNSNDKTTMTSPQLFEPTPSFTLRNPHDTNVIALMELSDGSFFSCSTDAKRWVRTNDNNIQLLGTYQGRYVWCVIEKDDNTLLTGSLDELKVWSKTTCECLHTLPMDSAVCRLLKTKDNSRVVCGRYDGTVEVRRVSDLGVISSFSKIHYESVYCICELDDDSFVSAAYITMKRWDVDGRVLQTFSGHSKTINRVIELNKDVIVSASDDTTVKMWKVSTGECLRTLTLHSNSVIGLEKVSDGVFASGYWGGGIVVWDERGDFIETHQSKSGLRLMTRLRDGSIVTADRKVIEIRQL